VVNHVSESVSVVDLSSMNVVATLPTGDEPADVVFAGTPQRAFATASQADLVQVFDPASLGSAPIDIAIEGKEPRALAVSPDGQTVYAAVFESGNTTTILGGGSLISGGFPPNIVNDPTGPHGGVNPPPNDGAVFNPPMNTALPTPPKVGLIVRRDANSLSVSYTGGLMNACMALGVNPATGDVTVVGTDATNEVRFEPVLNGRFVRVDAATFTPGGGTSTISDLNPHLTYGATVPFAPIP